MDRRAELRRAIGGGDGASMSVPLRLCEVGVERLSAQGVGVALISSPQSRNLLSASGALAGRAEELQFSLGEGPCLDAFSDGVPTLEPQLASAGRSRWPIFADAAVAAGIEAVFAFPLQVDAVRFGVLDVAHDTPGMLADDQLADALALADIAAEMVLNLQRDTNEDQVADELGGVGSERIVVHQATGMIAAQAEISMDDALAWLRGHAYSADRTLYDVSRDIVARRLGYRS